MFVLSGIRWFFRVKFVRLFLRTLLPTAFCFSVRHVRMEFSFGGSVGGSKVGLPSALFFCLGPRYYVEKFCSLVVIDGVLGLSVTIGTYNTLTKGAVLSPTFAMGAYPFAAVFTSPSGAYAGTSGKTLYSLDPSPLSGRGGMVFPTKLLVGYLLVVPPSRCSAGRTE